MEFSARKIDPAVLKTPCLVAGVLQDDPPRLTPSGEALDEATGGRLGMLLEGGDLGKERGATLVLYDPPGIAAERLLLVGLGKTEKLDAAGFREAVAAAARTLETKRIGTAHLLLCEAEVKGCSLSRRAQHLVEAAAEAAYRFDQTKSGKKEKPALKKVVLATAGKGKSKLEQGIVYGKAVARGTALARDLGNLPGNLCTPRHLASRARALGRKHGLKVSVLDEAAMRKLKMDALLSVSRGSREPARLVVMEHHGGKAKEKPVVLVGKGLTFDAGGISIKPAAAMDEMKFDMCGGASVFGAMLAAAELALPLNLVGIVPASENLPDGAANKPGDVVTSMAGKTIEILNTDAEGRLILCDALTYAERFKPRTVVDIATLTGACVVALGHHATGLFSDCDGLAEELLAAGEIAADRAWRMPLWDDYGKQLKSNFADLANIGGRDAGAVTAACFLKEFTEKYDWAHLDIAGTAWRSGDKKGATGRPVGLLVEFLRGRCEKFLLAGG